MRILCPFCREDTVEAADLVPCTRLIYEWEIDEATGLPCPADYGAKEACWEASEPEDPDKPYVCPPCYKYLSADMLLIEQDENPEPETV